MFNQQKLKDSLSRVNRKWGLYCLGTLCIYLAINQLTHNIDVYYDASIGILFRRWIEAAVFALPILYCKRKAITYVWLFLLGAYLWSIMWYFRTYATIMPLSSYLMFNNTDGLASYISGSFQAKDGWIMLPLIIFGIVYHCIKQQESGNNSGKTRLLLPLLLCFLVSLPYWPNKRSEIKQPIILNTLTSARAFKEYGIINFWIYQLSKLQSLSPAEKKTVDDFFNKHQLLTPQASSYQAENKNLILILVESLQSWAIGLNHQGVAVTPNLDELLLQKNNVYIPHMLSQVKDGRSSDAQLIINTGLLPLNTGAAASLCADNLYPSLPHALKIRGYHTASLTCDDKDFWNQGRTSAAYGFDKLYAGLQNGYEKMYADSLLFDAGIPILNQLPQPFYAQVVTFSMHMPYNDMQNKNSRLLNKTFPNEEIRNYLISVELFDQRLSLFLDKLKEHKLYDNSIIVIVGDHEQLTFNHYEGRSECKVSDCLVPFIVLNSSLHTQHSHKVFGQIDIYPTLLHLMGCSDYNFRGLGEDIFGDKVSDMAVYRTTETLYGNEAQPNDSIQKYRKDIWRISDIVLRMDYFNCR